MADAPLRFEQIQEIDTTDFEVNTESGIQAHLLLDDRLLAKARTTGVSEGGAVTVDGGVNVGTTFSVTAGKGQIHDETLFPPTNYIVEWSAATGISPLGNGLNWVYVDNAGAITVTQVEPTESTIRTRLYLWRLSVIGGIITGETPVIILSKQYAVRLDTLGRVIGNRRKTTSDLLLEPSGTGLNFRITSGSFYVPAGNYPNVLDVDFVAYDVFDTGAIEPDLIQYRLPNGTNPLGNITYVDVAYYAPAGVRTLIPEAATRLGVHYVWQFSGAGGNVRLTYGANFYATLELAKAALTDLAAYASAPVNFQTGNAFLLGAIIAAKSETNLNNATFVYTNLAGSFSSGTVAIVGGADTFQTIYANSVANPELTTTSEGGSVDYRCGSGADTDNVFRVQNTAGTVTFSINGNGALLNTKLSQLASTTSAELASIISDETGSGLLVFNTSPTFITPALDTPSSGTLTNCTGLPQSGVVNLTTDLAAKQPTLISGTNIKTIDGNSLLGSGNLVVGNAPNSTVRLLQSLGSTIKADTPAIHSLNAGTSPVSGTINFTLFFLLEETLITSVGMFMNLNGIYTPSNTNGVAIYSIGATDLTKEGEGLSDTFYRPANPNTFVTVNLTSPITLAAGVYAFAYMWSGTAVTQAPRPYQILNPINSEQSLVYMEDIFPHTSTISSQTTFPTTITIANLAANQRGGYARFY